MTRLETLERCLELVLSIKRINSAGCRNAVAAEGQEEEFDLYSQMAQNLREMMREKRFGPGTSTRT